MPLFVKIEYVKLATFGVMVFVDINATRYTSK